MNSPCIDTGDPDLDDDDITWQSDSDDQDPDGTRLDMGAFYYDKRVIDTTSPAPPQNLTATPGDQQISLTWDANTEPDLSHYVVYQSTTQGFTPTSADSVGKVLQPDASFTATDLTNGVTYYFKVAAVDESGNYSAASEEVSATPNDPLRVGLVAHYPFSGSANDESGNANHGTVYGAALAADRFGNASSAYSFDGVDDEIDLGDPANGTLDLGTESFSFIGWVEKSNLTNAGIFSKRIYPSASPAHELYLSNVLNYYRNGQYYASSDISTTIQTGWHQIGIAYVSTQSRLHLFLDRAHIDSVSITATGSVDNNSSFYLGRETNPSVNRLTGLLDDIRIYNRALSAAEIEALYQEGGWLGTATGYITGTGEVAFPGTDISMNFTSQSGTDTIQVAAIDADPGGTLPTDVSLAADRYWTITHTGSGDFTVDLIFNLGAGAFDADEQIAPGNLKLLRRESNGSSEWAAIRSAATATDSTVTFASLTSFSQFAIGRWTDAVGPAITNVAATASPSIGNAITVTATVTDASPLQSVTLHYIKGGASSYSQVNMLSLGADTHSGTIPASAVTPAGVAYFVAAEDNLGNRDSSDVASVQVAFQPETFKTSMTGSAFRDGFPKNKWRLISIPGDIADTTVKSIIREELDSAPSDETWKIFRYMGPGPDDYVAATSFASGESYFLKQIVSEQAIHFTLGYGQSVDLTGQDLRIPSRRWRFVSSPYPFPVTMDVNQSVFIGPYTYGEFGSGGQEGWSGQVQDNFEPWGGYIIYNNTDQTQTLELRPPSLAKALSEWIPLGLAKGDDEPVEAWLLDLSVEGERYFDAGNIVGRLQGAAEGLDDYDHPEPPYLDGYISLAMERPDWSPNAGLPLFTSDVRSLEEVNGAWDLDLRTKGETGPIAITCAIQGEMPPDLSPTDRRGQTGMQVVLLDLVQRRFYDLTAGEQPDAVTDYSEKLPYRLKVIAGTPAYVQGAVEEVLAHLPEDFALSQNYPNPFNPSTTIRFALPRPTLVSLKVYNLLGQEVVTLEGDWRDIGYHEVVWDGRDRAGRSAATGMYFAVLHADGHVLTRKMVLLK